MFAGINMFLARLRLIARVVRAVTIIITLKGVEEINTEKMTTKHPEEHFFTRAVRKRQQTFEWLLDFDWLFRSYDYLILTFYWFISVSGLKCISARQMLHFI